MTPEEEQERLRGYQRILQSKAEQGQTPSQSPTALAQSAADAIAPLASTFYGAPPFKPSEHVIWKWHKTVGIFNRHVTKEYYITNLRVLFLNHELQAYNQAPIQMVEAFVVSSHTERTGSGTRYSAGLGMSFGSWNGSSRTYGVVNFMAAGQVIGSVYVPDPHGLVREVKAIKKTTKELAPKVTHTRTEANSKPDMAIELEKLAALFKDGMLTQDEYNKAKKKLLT